MLIINIQSDLSISKLVGKIHGRLDDVQEGRANCYFVLAKRYCKIRYDTNVLYFTLISIFKIDENTWRYAKLLRILIFIL